MLLFVKLRQKLIARGATDIELSWILEDNAGMRNIIKSIGGREYKRYRVFEKDFTDNDEKNY